MSREQLPQVQLGLGSWDKEEPKGDPALSEANATTDRDPPPNIRRFLTVHSELGEDYENFRELIEVVGCIVLPTGQPGEGPTGLVRLWEY